jgi:hypothetical protein
MCTMREIIVIDYIERESCGTLLAILYLDLYVWNFYAFLLDSSTYTNSLWCLRFYRRSHLLNWVLLQLFFPFLHALERSSPVVFIKSTKDFMLYNL